MKCTFFSHIGPFFPSGRGSFSSLGCGARGSRVLTGKVWVPAVLRGSCSGRSKSLELASNHGTAFRRAKLRKTMKTTPYKVSARLLLYGIMSVSHRATSSQALYLVAATIQQQQHMKLASFCDDHGLCICVCVFVPRFLST